MSPLVVLFVVWALSQRSHYRGDLGSAPNGPDALENLQGQKLGLTQIATRSKTQTTFPT